ncbi:MAG: hypothetical protein NTV63_00545 [Candidatus Woesearchaeota archaeon]|nr:hypothetical protein [Candidatus Woesearchaeota archaeon]
MEKGMCGLCRKRKGLIKFRYSPLLCGECFSKILEKRIRKGLREEKAVKRIIMAAKGKGILILDDGTYEAKATIFLMKKINRGFMAKIIVKKKIAINEDIFEDKKSILEWKRQGFSAVILPWSCEKEANYFLRGLFHECRAENLGLVIERDGVVFVKLFLGAIAPELKFYCRFKKLGNAIREKFRNDFTGCIGKEIELLEKKYPGTKFGLLRSAKAMKKILWGKSQKTSGMNWGR